MLYKLGDHVQYKKYHGEIVAVYEYNKTYGVQLVGYRGFGKIIRQVDQHDLFQQVALSI